MRRLFFASITAFRVTDTTAPGHLGFPPPLLGMRPQRLPVLWRNELGFALNMPAGIQILPDNWYPAAPLLAESINYQAARGKPELGRLGVQPEGAVAIYTMEPDISGVALFAFGSEGGEFWRNAYGSELFTLRFEFIADQAPDVKELDCDLPIARHGTEKRVLISHRTGKKAKTQFRRLERFGRFSRWQATTSFYRMHQLLIHAREVGISVLGDTLYGDSQPLYLSSIKRGFRPSRNKEEAALYEGCPVHLAEVTLPLPDSEMPVIKAPQPNRYGVLLKRLRAYG